MREINDDEDYYLIKSGTEWKELNIELNTEFHDWLEKQEDELEQRENSRV